MPNHVVTILDAGISTSCGNDELIGLARPWRAKASRIPLLTGFAASTAQRLRIGSRAIRVPNRENRRAVGPMPIGVIGKGPNANDVGNRVEAHARITAVLARPR